MLSYTKLFDILSITFVHSSEMEDSSARYQFIEINFESILSITYVKEMPNLHTNTTPLSGSFGVVMLCSLRGGWEGGFKNGVRMKNMITLEYIELSFC